MASLGVTGYGARIDAEARDREQRIAAQDAEIERLAELRKMGAPDFLTSQLAHCHRTAAIAAVENLGAGIQVLGGDVDTGKSIAALWWLRTAAGPVFYCQANELAQIADWHRKPWQGKRSIVLDDVGTESVKAIARVQDIVLYAHGRRSCTLLITTNLTQEDQRDQLGFKSRYGQRVARRMRERPAHGPTPWVAITNRTEI